MISNIHLLDSETIDKIAAGEVVQNPVSVVKELVENAIDAHATEIVIEIRKGGNQFIRVTDNGYGIASHEVELAIVRHATSKINQIEDLYQLSTLGFRGEALSSISSVSRFEILTKTSAQDSGVQLLVVGGKITSLQPIGTANGTTIIVKDLFFNVPARQKFLKSDGKEGAAVYELISKMALLNNTVSFKFIRDYDMVLSTPKNTNINNVITSVLGSDFSAALMPITHKSPGVSVEGFITNLNYFRSNRKMQILFINQRYVVNREISNAIEKAYSQLIPHGKFPGFVLYLTLDPQRIDVNVHPQKAVVKIEQLQDITEMLYTMVLKMLKQRFMSKKMTSNPSSKNQGNTPYVNDRPLAFDIEQLDFVSPLKSHSKPITGHRLNEPDDFSIDLISKNPNQDTYKKGPKEILTDDIFTKETIDSPYDLDSSSISAFFGKETDALRYIGSAFKGYLIFEHEKDQHLLIMDQHAAHERIQYEILMKQYQNQSIQAQHLLVPEIIHVDALTYEKVLPRLQLFEKIGFMVKDFGKNTFSIEAFPSALVDYTIKDVFYHLMDVLDEIKDFNHKDLLPDVMAQIIKKACSLSVKIKDSLNIEEVQHLQQNLAQCEMPHTCPHGRPIWVTLTLKELEKLFYR